MNMFTGLKTILVGLLLAVSPVVMQYVAGIDWTTVLPPSLVWLAPTITGALMVAMRFFTTTPVASVLKKPDEPSV